VGLTFDFSATRSAPTVKDEDQDPDPPAPRLLVATSAGIVIGFHVVLAAAAQPGPVRIAAPLLLPAPDAADASPIVAPAPAAVSGFAAPVSAAQPPPALPGFAAPVSAAPPSAFSGAGARGALSLPPTSGAFSFNPSSPAGPFGGPAKPLEPPAGGLGDGAAPKPLATFEAGGMFGTGAPKTAGAEAAAPRPVVAASAAPPTGPKSAEAPRSLFGGVSTPFSGGAFAAPLPAVSQPLGAPLGGAVPKLPGAPIAPAVTAPARAEPPKVATVAAVPGTGSTASETALLDSKFREEEKELEEMMKQVHGALVAFDHSRC
jgi:hypothetical protein